MIQFGLMNRGQYPADADPARMVEEMVEQARTANALGFDSIMKGSHYSSYPFLDLQQAPLLARFSAEAPDLRLIAGVILLPLHKPLDIAETWGTIDALSGGKLIFGVGIGYREVEFNAFGTTMAGSGARFEENLEAVVRLWTEERVTMKGSHFELNDAFCSMKPVQKPMPPLWTGANADRAIRRAARLTDAWFVNPHGRLDTIAKQMEIYKRALDEYGKPFPTEFPMMREVVVGKTRAEAMRMAQPFLETKYKAYHNWGQGKVMPEGDQDFGQAYDDLVRDRFLIGSPDEVAEQILDIVKNFGVNHFVMGVQFPGMPQSMVLDEMHLLAEEVFPKVRAAL